MSIQFIEDNGLCQYAIVPAKLYDELVEKAEMLEDVKLFMLNRKISRVKKYLPTSTSVR